VVPAAHFLGGLLRFQIEIDNIFQGARLMKTSFAMENNFKLLPDTKKLLNPKSE
jgi:hypothetical protein